MAECPKCWMPMDDFSSMCVDCLPDEDEEKDGYILEQIKHPFNANDYDFTNWELYSIKKLSEEEEILERNYFVPVNIVIWVIKELVLWEINIDIAINYIKVYWKNLNLIFIESNLLEEIWEGTYIWTMIKPLYGRKYRAFKWDYDWYWDTPIEALLDLKNKLYESR